jgi:hypothetical protein
MHSQVPEAIAARRAQLAAGGRGRSTLRRAAKLLAAGPWGPVAERLADAMAEVVDGTLDPRRLEALSQGARALVVVNDQAAVLERLEELERQLAAQGSDGPGERLFGPAGDLIEPEPEELGDA